MKELIIQIGAGEKFCGRCHMLDRMLWERRCLLFKKKLKTLIVDIKRKGLKTSRMNVSRCKDCLEAEKRLQTMLEQIVKITGIQKRIAKQAFAYGRRGDVKVLFKVAKALNINLEEA